MHSCINCLARLKDKIFGKFGVHISFFAYLKLYHRKNFKPYLSRKDINELWEKLIKGLDKESIDIADLFIKRIKKYIKRGIFPIFFLTKVERRQLADVEYFYKNAVLKHSNNSFSLNNYFLPINNFEDKNFYFKCGMDDIRGEGIKHKSFIDVGAYIGDSTIVFTEYTDKKVYAFEPNIDYYKLLLKTIELNNFKEKIVPIPKGLGGKNEELCIDSMDLIENSKGKMKNCAVAEITTLDDFVKENNVEVGLIKTDIEGFEPKFLKGAIETIKTQKPVLLISIYHNAHDFFEIKPMIESWNLGYTFKIRKYSSKRFDAEIILICSTT
ncbi:MAG: FkbM family methyltransferase [Elusimicrobiota bacterium]|jgi:FkbM family methyltransferase|nr:FkbM family methyltransferase [Elusimicrobiota bacterium]